MREAISEIVTTYSARPAEESAVEALIQLFVTHAEDAGQFNLNTWHQAVSTAPHLLSKSSLVSEDDERQFVDHVAGRMGVDPSADIRPALLVHISMATVNFVLDRWLTSDSLPSSPFHIQLEEALRIALAGFG